MGDWIHANGAKRQIGELKVRRTTQLTGAKPKTADRPSRFFHDLDLFNKKLALRSLIGALWLFLSPLNVSPDQAGLVLGVDHRTVRDLFVSFRKWLTPIVDRLNEELIIGGAGNDVELDEVSFRSKGLDDKDLCQNFIWFSRFTWLLGTSK